MTDGIRDIAKTPALVRWKDRLRGIDWLLLIFLLLFTIDSVIVKPVAIGLACLVLLSKIKEVRLKEAPPFYLLLPAMEIARFFILNRDFSAGHTITLVIGCCYWLMAWIAFIFMRFRTVRSGWERISATLDAWFVLNVIYSLLQLGKTMLHSGSINPYALPDPTYGNSTGDFIKGLLLAPCYLNMFINSFFVIWFLYRGRWGAALLAAFICCLTTTNFANIIFLPVLLLLFILKKDRQARLCILGCLGIFIAFSVFISRGNIRYLGESVKNTSGLDFQMQARPGDSDSLIAAKQNIREHYMRLAQPNGKMLSWKETWAYVSSGPQQALLGAGMGNFSSLLALQMAHIYGRKHSRFYAMLPEYVHPAYRANHYQIMADVYALPEGYHSARHMPHSFPNQLLGEYGLLGLIFFIFGYAWYFLKRVPLKGYFGFIVLLTAGYLWFDYLFEYLSVMLFFELFYLIYRYGGSKTLSHE